MSPRRPAPTLRHAIEVAARDARAGVPNAKRRRNELVAYAASRGVRYRTLAALCDVSLETVHRWTGGRRLEREVILNEPAPPPYVHPGQGTLTR